ncbi:hypothetical protein DRQ32_08340 [bacterium]|nr:MAG: hypothetical protein DRQ32_08340 [bacterium]
MKHISTFVAILALIPVMAHAGYESVISVSPAVNGSSIAVEVPTTGGALSGLRWFHNDDNQVFPRVVIVEGQPNTPPDLTNPGLILDEVTGVSTGWGELYLASPVTSSTGTAYAVFFFPADEATHSLGEGGGPGIGFRETEVENPAFYISTDAVHWARFDSAYELGVEPVYTAARGEVRSISEMGVQIALPDPVVPSERPQSATRMLQPHPNPFNPRVELSYSLSAPTSVQLRVYDIRGRLVKMVYSGRQSAGDHLATWDGVDDRGKQVASGVYFARFEAGGIVQTHQMVLVR